MDLPGKQPWFPYPLQRVCQIQSDSRERNFAWWRFYSGENVSFPRLVGSVAMSPQGSDHEVIVPRPFHFPGRWQVQENLCLTFMFLLFFEQDHVSFCSLVFPFQAPGVFSFVSCSLSFISSWGGLDLSKNPHFHKAKVKMARTNNPRSIASIITHNGIEKETFGVAQITDVLIAMLPSGSFAGWSL